jgi:hypothetical protein
MNYQVNIYYDKKAIKTAGFPAIFIALVYFLSL